ncbi:MAG: tyrosine-type recombinase/integrase, partial [Deltaproteobacteria bacterium]|nr:tyrosine-type recombinase/integrase [Deltaproteobacteria bacterium]
MSVEKRKTGFFLLTRPFGDRLIGVKTTARTKSRAKEIEMAILTACRSGDYRGLDPESREVCVRIFQNQGWEIPGDLRAQEPPQKEVTLWRAVEIFLNYPSVRDCKAKYRYILCLKHIVRILGKETPIKEIWAPQVRMYQAERLASGARPTTVNWETRTLSRLFRVMVEMQIVSVNPVRLVEQLSRKSSEREAYISLPDVQAIAHECPEWFEGIIWTAFFTGMRRGEILSLKRNGVDLSRRIITLSPDETKEGHWKRVPIHRDLVPILENAMRVPVLACDDVFVLRDRKGVRPLLFETARNPWPRACEALELPKPWPRFHDLRHTWKSNARRSGMDPEIREAILGHSSKQRLVSERYGRISDKELVAAIDSMTFEHGETEILVAKRKSPSGECGPRRG